MTTMSNGAVVIPKNIGRQSILRDRNKNTVAPHQPTSEHVVKWLATPPNSWIVNYLGTLYDKEGIEAILEFIDNSIDALSKKSIIKILSDPNNKHVSEIIIADNGTGISEETLPEAMRLAADTGHDDNDIGKFGTGMKSAAFNLGTKMVMYTRDVYHPNCPGLRVEMSIESMNANGGEPGVLWNFMSTEDNIFFAKHVPEEEEGVPAKNGTVIHITGIRNNDRKAKTARAFREKLTKRFAVIYRDMLQNPDVRELTVMGSRNNSIQKVEPTPENDPIGWDTYPDGQLCQWTNVKWKGSNFQYRVMFISKALAAEVDGQPDLGQRGRRATSRQGYSFIRAGRLIASGEFKNVVGIEANAAYNGLLVEVRFDPNLDDEFGVKYTKNGVSLKQGLRDKIESLTKQYRSAAHQSNRVKFIAKESTSQKEATLSEFDAYSKQFLPTKEKALSLPRPHKVATSSTSNGQNKTSTGTTKRKRRSKFVYDFRPDDGVGRDELWKTELKADNTIEAHVSTKHPLYDYFHSLNPKDEEHPEYKEMRTTLKHIFFALCTTDLEFEGEDTDFLERFKNTFARNLRTLMG